MPIVRPTAVDRNPSQQVLVPLASTEPRRTTSADYEVYVGVHVSGSVGPGAIAIVVRRGENDYEKALPLPGVVTGPRAWALGVETALDVLSRPHATVRIYVRDVVLVRRLDRGDPHDGPNGDVQARITSRLAERANTDVLWLPSADGDPWMARAHLLASRVASMASATTRRST